MLLIIVPVDKRINVGRIEAGVINESDEIRIIPSGEVTKIKSIERFLVEPKKAIASECVGITTEYSVFLCRGNVLCLCDDEPVLTDSVHANIFWMTKKSFDRNEKLTLRCATQEIICKIEKMKKWINSSTLEVKAENSDEIKNLEMAEVIIKTKKPITIKDFNDVQELGRFVLVHDENTCVGGIITMVSYNGKSGDSGIGWRSVRDVEGVC